MPGGRGRNPKGSWDRNAKNESGELVNMTPEGVKKRREQAKANANYEGKPNHSGGMKAQAREIFAEATRDGAYNVAKIAKGEKVKLGDEEVTPVVPEMLKAVELAAKHSLPDLLPVVEDRFIEALATALANESRVAPEVAESIVDAVMEILKEDGKEV